VSISATWQISALQNCTIDGTMRVDLDELAGRVAEKLGSKRFLHSLGVTHSAVVLARVHGLNPGKAAVCGMLHDCAKSSSALVCTDAGEFSAHVYAGFPGMLHAPLGAVMARDEFGVSDLEVLEAIANHPTGKPNPSKLLRSLVVADFCEPTREFDGVGDLRRIARTDLDRAFRLVLERKIRFLEVRGQQVHPAVLRTLESISR
jgi:predicted HD superfamily hydrolase involved in NAD metabolism